MCVCARPRAVTHLSAQLARTITATLTWTHVSIRSPARCCAAAWLKRLSGPAVPSGQRVIRTRQLLRSTQAAMRVVQHDPLLLNLVNILTWIPQSLWTQLAAYEGEGGGGGPTRVCVIEKKKDNNNSVGCFLLYTKRDGDVTGCPEACGLVDNELAASRLFIKEWFSISGFINMSSLHSKGVWNTRSASMRRNLKKIHIYIYNWFHLQRRITRKSFNHLFSIKWKYCFSVHEGALFLKFH